MSEHSYTRRDLLRTAALGAAALTLPRQLTACRRDDKPGAGRAAPLNPEEERLATWVSAIRSQPSAENSMLGRATMHAGELAVGTPYLPYTLDAYLKAGGSPAQEPLTLSLSHFDCVTLVESCLAVARVAELKGPPTWDRFGEATEAMRYRGGERRGYTSRLHYFSEWISDGEKRGLVKDMGAELNGAEDARPLRFMTDHRSSYPALANEGVFKEIGRIERSLGPRRVVPAKRIPEVVNRLEHGDVLGFATEIPGLDVTHAAFAYRDREGVLRVLHAPLSGGTVAITRTTLPEYVAAIKRSTGILVARPIG